MTDKITVRFAPSPTGRLHIGNIRTAICNWLYCKPGGRYILRLDDTDTARSTQAFADGIVQDLAWLGVVPDLVERQSDRKAKHDAAADALRAAGLLYPCYETPDEIERKRKRAMARGKPPVYDRAALKLTSEERAALEAEGRKPHWRFLLPNFDSDPFTPTRTDIQFEDIFRGTQIVDLASMSDPVLIREDGTYLYTLPSVVDDLDMGVTHVIRGGDHVTNTGAQIAIMQALGAVELPAFGHHNLLIRSDGEGLSKRSGALSVAQLRENGFEPTAISAMAALTGTDRDVVAVQTLSELGEAFDGASISKSPARFDPDELAMLNERIVHAMPYEMAAPRLNEAEGVVSEEFWNLVRENLGKFSDINGWKSIVGGDVVSLIDDDDRDFLSKAAELLPDDPWDGDIWKTWTSSLKAETNRKGKGLFMPLRKALTGKEHGPDMGALLPLIGREKTIHRLS